MSTKHKNPFRENSRSHPVFNLMRRMQVYTRSGLVEIAVNELGLDEPADESKPYKFKVEATISSLLSPRAVDDCKGDPRGNAAAHGHLFYQNRVKKVDGEERKFQLRWRDTPLEPLQPKGVKKVKGAKKVKVADSATVSDTVPAETTEVKEPATV